MLTRGGDRGQVRPRLPHEARGHDLPAGLRRRREPAARGVRAGADCARAGAGARQPAGRATLRRASTTPPAERLLAAASARRSGTSSPPCPTGARGAARTRVGPGTSIVLGPPAAAPAIRGDGRRTSRRRGSRSAVELGASGASPAQFVRRRTALRTVDRRLSAGCRGAAARRDRRRSRCRVAGAGRSSRPAVSRVRRRRDPVAASFRRRGAGQRTARAAGCRVQRRKGRADWAEPARGLCRRPGSRRHLPSSSPAYAAMPFGGEARAVDGRWNGIFERLRGSLAGLVR